MRAGGFFHFFLIFSFLLLSYGRLEKWGWSSGAACSFFLPVNNKLWYRPNNNDFLTITSPDRIVSSILLTETVENLIEKLKLHENWNKIISQEIWKSSAGGDAKLMIFSRPFTDFVCVSAFVSILSWGRRIRKMTKKCRWISRPLLFSRNLSMED